MAPRPQHRPAAISRPPVEPQSLYAEFDPAARRSAARDVGESYRLAGKKIPPNRFGGSVVWLSKQLLTLVQGAALRARKLVTRYGANVTLLFDLQLNHWRRRFRRLSRRRSLRACQNKTADCQRHCDKGRSDQFGHSSTPSPERRAHAFDRQRTGPTARTKDHFFTSSISFPQQQRGF